MNAYYLSYKGRRYIIRRTVLQQEANISRSFRPFKHLRGDVLRRFVTSAQSK